MKLSIKVIDRVSAFRVGREYHTIVGYSNFDGKNYMFTTYEDEPNIIFPCRWIDIDGEWFLYDTSDITILDILSRYFDGEK